MLATIVAVLLVVSCGGGSSQTAGIDRGGIRTTSVGPIDGFGSIVLNGERYDVSAALITDNGTVVTESELRVGQIVLVDAELAGSAATPVAKTVVYESNLKGPVTSVDLQAGEFVALGQVVIVSADTIFGTGISPSDLSGISPGDVVEVSGLSDSAGAIRATRIDLETGLYVIQLTGMATINASGALSIGAQVVDISGVMITDDFPGGIIRDGDRVRVIGAALGATNEIIATEVAYRGDILDAEDGDGGEVEGLVTNFVSAQDFLVSGIAVSTDGQTQYSGGMAADLADNVRIEVEGVFDSAGVLNASQVEFKREGDALIEATVDTVDPADGLVTVFGVEIATTAGTIMSDERDKRRPFTLNDLAAGDFLKVSGSWNGNRLIATQLERIAGEDKYKLKGTISAAADPGFTLLGKSVSTADGTTDYEVNDVSTSRAQFFLAIDACLATSGGCRVEAGWQASGGLLVADEVELD